MSLIVACPLVANQCAAQIATYTFLFAIMVDVQLFHLKTFSCGVLLIMAVDYGPTSCAVFFCHDDSKSDLSCFDDFLAAPSTGFLNWS